VELLYASVRGVNERRSRSQYLQVLRLPVEMRGVAPAYWHDNRGDRPRCSKAHFHVEGALLSHRDRLESKRNRPFRTVRWRGLCGCTYCEQYGDYRCKLHEDHSNLTADSKNFPFQF